MPLFRGSKNATIVNGEIVATQADIVEALQDVNIVATNLDGENTIETVASINNEIVSVSGIKEEILQVEDIKNEIVITSDNLEKVTNFSDVYLGASDFNPQTRTDGSSLLEGDLYFNTSLEEFRAWTGSEWYAAPPNTTSNVYIDRFSGDGQTKDFTVGIDPKNKDFVQVYIDGVYQQKNTYSLSNSVISFSEAPPLGTGNIEFVVIASVNIGETDAYLVNVEDSGAFYNGGDVESVLQEVGNTLNTKITETEAKNIFSASGDLSYNTSTGEFSVTTYKSSDFDSDFGGKSTSDLSEGSNLYYTDTRARNALSASGDLSYSSSTGIFSFSETDPVVGAISGIVKADGAGNISSAIAGTDYSDPSDTLVDSDIGSTVQEYDANTAKLDTAQAFTAEQTFNQNIVMASGKGIDFSATGGSGTSELLDDYEEGTFTTDIKDSNGVLISSGTSGRYIKAGNFVHISFEILKNSVSSTADGNPYIDLPFNPGANSHSTHAISYISGAGSIVAVHIRESDPRCYFATSIADSYDNRAKDAAFGGSLRLYGSATYHTL